MSDVRKAALAALNEALGIPDASVVADNAAKLAAALAEEHGVTEHVAHEAHDAAELALIAVLDGLERVLPENRASVLLLGIAQALDFAVGEGPSAVRHLSACLSDQGVARFNAPA